MNHAVMVSILAKGGAIDEIVRQHGASKDSPDLPTAHALDLPTPKNMSNVEKTPHPCRYMATLHAARVRWLSTGWYLRTDADIANSRKRDRCHVGVPVEG